MHPARTSAGPVVSALCAPPSCVRPVPVNPDQGGTHGLLRSVISCRHRVEYTVPDTDPAPPDEPIVAEGAIAVGNVGPGRSRPEPPVDAVRNLPVVHPSDATRLVRQEWFDDQPFEIDRFTTAVRQAALLFQTSEPAIPKGRYSFMRAQPNRPAPVSAEKSLRRPFPHRVSNQWRIPRGCLPPSPLSAAGPARFRRRAAYSAA